MGYALSPFPDFESYLRIVVGLDEDDIQLNLKQYNSNFITCKKSPGIYSVKEISEFVYTMGDHEKTLQLENDEISVKTKLILTQFGGTFVTLRLDEKSFFNALLRFTPNWDYKLANAIYAVSPGVYISEKTIN